MRYGVQCTGEQVVFRGWEPGNEYVEKLTVKNVSTKLKKLKYKLPKTRFFSLAFPETITLSPGMQADIDVVFRPLVAETYEDTIFFKLEEGAKGVEIFDQPPRGFHVAVKALLPRLEASCPACLDLGLCPTAEIARRSFLLTNEGEVDAPFEWTTPPPFQSEPHKGVVAVGKSVNMTVSVRPDKAEVVVGRAVCRVGEGVNAVKPRPTLEMRLSAIGKFPHITLSDERIDFGDVLPYCKTDDVRRDVSVVNASVVPATVRVRGANIPFRLSPDDFVVPPQSEQQVSITYAPTAAGTYSAEGFEFWTPGGNAPKLLLTGCAVAPIVRVEKKEDPFAGGYGVPNSVNFGSVKVGEAVSRALFVKNYSDMPLRFQFVADGTMFQFSATRGIVPPHQESPVKLTFVPAKPLNFYHRCFLLVQHRMPLFVDLLGTGYDDTQRPLPLRHAHIQAFRNRVARGLAALSPDELDDLAEKSDEPLLFARVGAKGHDQVLDDTTVKDPLTRSGECLRGDVAVAHEYFGDCDDDVLHVSTRLVDFAEPDDGTQVADFRHETLTITNRCHASVALAWRPSNENASVAPGEAVIPAGQHVDFQVSYSPARPREYAFAALEAAAFFETQKSFRTVNDATLTPPWHLQVLVAGHSFTSGQGGHTSVAFEPPSLVFPGCHVGDATYQTLTLFNRGESSPALFRFRDDPTFSVQPAAGLVPPGGFQLLLVRFHPVEATSYERNIEVRVNADELTVHVAGSGYVPRLELIVEGDTLAFEPTCVGLSSKRQFTVHNASRIPALFEAVLPARATTIFAVAPTSGLLRGNESQTITVTFAPRKPRSVARAKCVVRARPIAGATSLRVRDARQLGNPTTTVPVVQEVTTSLVGPATCGVVAFEPSSLDFNTLLVNTRETQHLILANAADCAVKYTVWWTASSTWQPVGTGDELVVLDEPKGVLPARSRKRLRATFQPNAAGTFDVALVCRVKALSADGAEVQLDPDDAKLLALGDDARSKAHGLPNFFLSCGVHGKASFPTVVVRDARVQHGGTRLACGDIWTQLSLDALNATLVTPLTKDEVQLNLASSPDLSLLERVPLCFIPEPLGSRPQVIILDLHNPGKLPTAFSLHLPNERDVELEPWADEGEPTETDVRINRILDELKCFDVEPRGGRTLLPGASASVRLSYSFLSREFEGIHRLPILLRVAQGKQIWLDLVGQTLAPADEPRLLIPRSDPRTHRVKLSPVAVGTPPELAPLQCIELCNVGSAGLDYTVETPTVIDKVAADGRRRPTTNDMLLKIENNIGDLGPRAASKLRVRFLPLEIATYEARLDVRTSSSSVPLTLVLEGYDSHVNVKPPPALPDRQVVDVPGQIAVLSRDVVDFGTVPQRGRVTRLVVIRPAKGCIVDFEWERPNDDILDITPVAGTLRDDDDEESFATCRVVLMANCQPMHLDVALVLHLKQRAKLGKKWKISSSEASRESLAARCTVSREKQLTQTTLPSRRLPMMPTTPFQTDVTQSVTSLVSEGSSLACETTSTGSLALRIRADVTADDDLQLDDLYVPRPLAFIEPSAHAATDPLVDDDHHVPPPDDDAATRDLVVRASLARLFDDVLRMHETRDAIRRLPETPTLPYYAEVKLKPRLSDRNVFDGDELSHGDLERNLRDLGVRATSAELKRFFADLHANPHRRVHVPTWLDGLTPNVARAIENALEHRIHEDRVAERDARAAARETAERASAATRLQTLQRRKLAQRRCTAARVESTVAYREQANAATRLQAQLRRRQSRAVVGRVAQRHLDATALALLGDHDFQAMVHAALEGTVYNLLQEALHGDYDLPLSSPSARCGADASSVSSLPLPPAPAAPSGSRRSRSPS